MTDGQKLGGRLGPKVAQTVSDAVTINRRKSMPMLHDLAMKVQDSFFRLVSSEYRRSIGGLFAKVAKQEETPDWAKKTFEALATEDGQGWAWLGREIGGATLGIGLGSLINNELGPAIQQIIALNPHGIFDPSTAANMDARGIGGFTSPRLDALKNGLGTARFNALVEANRTPLDASMTVELLKRNFITSVQADRALRRAGYSETSAALIKMLQRLHITPEQAAALENFGVISRATGREIADVNGMTAGDYDKLALGGGIPPGTEELLAAFRRGIINESRLEKGITQSPIRREWFDVIKALRFSPPPTDIALSAATQNLVDKGKARRIVAENGINPAEFNWILESFGRPLSPEEAGRLFNRGIISRAQVRQMFLESSLKNKYVDLVYRLAERLPTMEMTIRMVRDGAMTKTQAIDNLMDLGFARKYAVQLVDLGTKEKVAATRDLAVGTIQELYEQRSITRRQALDFLDDHGYDKKESEWILSIRDMRRSQRLQNEGVSRVRARFITGRITSAEASAALDQLGVRAEYRDDLMDTWDVEKEVSRPELSVSQIQQAVKAALMTPAVAYDRLIGFGYTPEDAEILTSLATPRPKPPAGPRT